MIDLAPHNPYGLQLQRPLLAAAGCYGLANDHGKLLPPTQLGALISRGVALRGRMRPLRFAESAAGWVHTDWSVQSLEQTLEHDAPHWARWPTPVIMNLVQDHAAIAAQLEGVEGIAGVELWLGTVADPAGVVATCRAVTQLPLLAKISLNDGWISRATGCMAAGADAITICASSPASGLDSTGQVVSGWLSGPALFPTLLTAVQQAASQLPVPLVANGGVTTYQEYRALLQAGASAIQLGTLLLTNPSSLTTWEI